MNIDKKTLDALLSLSDAEFSKKISEITEKLGMGQSAVSPARVKMMLGSMSESDISRLVSSLGEERAAEILKTVKGEN